MIRNVLPSAFRLLTVQAEAGCSFTQATRSAVCRVACVGLMGNYTGGATTRSFVAPSMKAMEMPCSSDWLYGIPHPVAATRASPPRAASVGSTGSTGSARSATRTFVASSMSMAMEMPCSSDWLYGIPQPLVLQPESVAELLITCVGNHRTGIVRDITKTIAEFGGSITHSKSMALEGLQFVYMASVYVGDREKANLLRMTLNDMRVNATWIPVETTSASGAYGYKKHRLVVHGNQRSGLIFTLSEGLASKGVQINDMKQDTYPGKDRQMMVNWEAELGIPEEVPVDDVRALMADMASKEKNMVVEISA